MIAVQGVGWLDATVYGQLRRQVSISYAERMTLRELGKNEGLFRYPVKNFGRFESVTQVVCCVTALALQDAGIDYAEGRRLDIGLLGTDGTGCLESNRNYFEDYVKSGRTLSRANLFIYTLPSSPLAEAAVHFGLQGPQLYMRSARAELTTLIHRAAGMIRRGEVSKMLVYRFGAQAGFGMVLGAMGQGVCTLEQAIEMDERIEAFNKAAVQNEN
jgi:3-oxoacyl-[acyl-carrier-protein] synthase II